MKTSVSIKQFLQARKTDANADLIDRWHIGLETQCNMVPGEPVAGKKATWSDGIETWNSFRIPWGSNGAPIWEDFDIKFPLDTHCDAVGCTGWDWQRQVSVWVGFDFDALTHAKGLSAEALEQVKAKASALPYIETRRSTGGAGLHLYCYVADIAAATHTEHAALAKCILAKMSKETDFDFASQIDVCGSIMWIWARKMKGTPGLTRIKEATKVLTEADLPPDWRIEVKPAPTIAPKSGIFAPRFAKQTDPVEEAVRRNPNWGFLEEALEWTRTGDDFSTPTTTNSRSANLLRDTKDGVEVLYVQSSNAPPFKKDGRYNCFAAYRLVYDLRYDEAIREFQGRGFAQTNYVMLPTSKFFADRKKLEYLIDGVLIKGLHGTMGGPKKCLKTLTMTDALISLVTGTRWLDKFIVKDKHRVAYMTGESGREVLWPTVEQICKAKGVKPTALDDLLWIEEMPSFDNEENRDKIERMLEKEKPEVLVIDPTYMCMPGDTSAILTAQGKLLYLMSDLCKDHNTTLIVVHHTRKDAKGKPNFNMPTLDDLTGTGYAEWSAQWILFNRCKPYAADGKHTLWMNLGGRGRRGSEWILAVDEGPDGKPCWKTEVATLGENQEATSKSNFDLLCERIMDGARKCSKAKDPPGETKTKVFAAAGVKNDSNKDAALKLLLDTGALIETKAGKSTYLTVSHQFNTGACGPGGSTYTAGATGVTA